MTMRELQEAVFRLYEQCAYAEALSLVKEEAPSHPDRANDLSFWRLCLESVLGRTEEALATFAAVVARGDWLSPYALRSDPDLACLQGNHEFERMVAICEERKQEAQRKAVPVRLTRRPAGQNGPTPLLMHLHGNNHNAAEEIHHWEVLTERGWTVAAIQSSQVSGPDRYVWNDRDWAGEEVSRHAGELLASENVDRSRVVVSGFSMGGGTAIWLAAAGALGVRGFIALGPWMQNPEELRTLLTERVPQGLRGYIIVGERDRDCLRASRGAQAVLGEYGIPVEVAVVPGLAHSYPPDLPAHLERAIAFLFGK